MDPLSAIAAFNASYAIVKTAANNVQDIGALFRSLGKMESAKKAVDEAARKNSGKSDLELYAAQVELDNKWEEVRQLLIWSGHWEPYLKFVADRKKKRDQEAKEAARARRKRNKQIQDIAIIVGGVLFTVAICGAFIYAITNFK
jgi:hypothetical protein